MRDLFPNVHFETDFTYWPDDRFSVFSHVASPFAEENTERLVSVLDADAGSAVEPAHESDFPTEARIDLTRVFSGYGWQTDKQPDGSLVSWIGPRDVASVWTVVEPGRAYTVSARVTQAKGRARECLALVVNGQRAQPKPHPGMASQSGQSLPIRSPGGTAGCGWRSPPAARSTWRACGMRVIRYRRAEASLSATSPWSRNNARDRAPRAARCRAPFAMRSLIRDMIAFDRQPLSRAAHGDIHGSIRRIRRRAHPTSVQHGRTARHLQ